VLAAESDTWLANLLHLSLAINRVPGTAPPAAAAETVGIGRMQSSEEGRASNSLSGSGDEG